MQQIDTQVRVARNGVVEFPDGYIISGIFYNKNLAPYPIGKNKQGIRDDNLVTINTNLGMKETIVNSYNVAHFMNHCTSIINPNKIPNAGQIITDGNAALFTPTSTDDNLYAYDYSTKNVYVKKYESNTTSRFMYLDDNKIPQLIFVYNRGNSNIYSFGKIDFFNNQTYQGAIVNQGNGYYIPQFLNDAYGKIFYHITQPGSNYEIGYYTKQNNTRTVIKSENSGDKQRGALSNALEGDLTLDVNTYYRAQYGNSDHKLYIESYQINYNTNAITVNTVNVDTQISFNQYNGINVNNQTKLSCFVHNFDGTNYLTIFVINNQANPSTDINGSGKYYRITYMIDSTNPNQLYFVDIESLSTSTVIGYDLISNDRNKIAVVALDSIQFMTFNGITQSKNRIVLPAYLIAYLRDSQDRIFLVTSDSKIYMLTIEMPYAVIIKAEKDYYNYNGSDILTQIEIKVLDYNGNLMAINGDLIIKSDNATFTDGSKITNITTSATQPTKVDILIKDAGILNINFKANL